METPAESSESDQRHLFIASICSISTVNANELELVLTPGDLS